MKHILKILLTMLLLVCFFNSATAIIHVNDTLEFDVDGEINSYPNTKVPTTRHVFSSTTDEWEFYYQDDAAGKPTRMLIQDIDCLHKWSSWEDIPNNVGSFFSLEDSTDNQVGTGSLHISKQSTVNLVDIDITFSDDIEDLIPGQHYTLVIYTNILYKYYDGVYYTTSSDVGAQILSDCHCRLTFGSSTRYPCFSIGDSHTLSYYYSSHFLNHYNLTFDGLKMEHEIIRSTADDYVGISSFLYKDSNLNLIYDSGYTASNYTYIHPNESYYFYLKPQCDSTEYLIHSTITGDTVDPTITLSTNTSYIVGDIVKYVYNNLDLLTEDNTTYKLLTYSLTPEGNINIIRDLQMADYTGFINLNTIGMVPNKIYYCVMDDSVNYNQKNTFEQYKKLVGYYNLSHEYEYINDSCRGSNCQYTNNDKVNLVYNALTESTIIITDDSDVVIHRIDNVTGFGTVEFIIPSDKNKFYNYPSWTATLNVTCQDDLLVFWSEIEEEEYYNTSTPNEEIEENIEEFKTNIQPLKDLLFGFTGAIIDNPDYDNDGIIDNSDLDQWFNSIIPLILFLVLYILYKGLKER